MKLFLGIIFLSAIFNCTFALDEKCLQLCNSCVQNTSDICQVTEQICNCTVALDSIAKEKAKAEELEKQEMLKERSKALGEKLFELCETGTCIYQVTIDENKKVKVKVLQGAKPK